MLSIEMPTPQAIINLLPALPPPMDPRNAFNRKNGNNSRTNPCFFAARFEAKYTPLGPTLPAAQDTEHTSQTNSSICIYPSVALLRENTGILVIRAPTTKPCARHEALLRPIRAVPESRSCHRVRCPGRMTKTKETGLSFKCQSA